MNDTDALLSQLRDIHTPDVSLIPAPGWWIVLAVCVLLAVLLHRGFKRYLQRGWQREAKAALNRLRSEADSVPVSQSLSGISRLVRRVVLAARPRETVAGLQGEAWLDELDDICGKPLFKMGFGKLLELGPYQPNPQLSRDDLNALMDVVAELIDAAGRNSARKTSS